MEQPTGPNGPRQDTCPKGQLERMRKGTSKGKHCQNWQCPSPERSTGCILQLWSTRTFCSWLPLQAAMHQYVDHPAHWLESQRQWEWLWSYGSQLPLPTAQCAAKRQSGRAHDEDGSSRGKFFRGLICAAWIRRTGSDRMYFSIWKSMQLCLFIHLSWKRAETTMLLDLGATKNFINMEYAKGLWFPIKQLHWPRPVYNIDSTRNKNGDIEHYTDLEMQTGDQLVWLRFFLTDLANQKAILGYLWFAAMQPKIDWACGWIDSSQLPLILWMRLATESRIGCCMHTPAGWKSQVR